jgi:hypothetical protein
MNDDFRRAVLVLLGASVDAQPGQPLGPPGGKPAVVTVNSQKSLADAVGEGFGDGTWEYPTRLLPREYPDLTYVSGPGDRGLGPKGAWRKPVVLTNRLSSVRLAVNVYRRRERPAAAGGVGSRTPFAPLDEPDYRYVPAEFHGLRAAAATEGERQVFAFRDGDLLFKIEAAGGKPEARRSSIAAVAEAIWEFRRPK